MALTIKQKDLTRKIRSCMGFVERQYPSYQFGISQGNLMECHGIQNQQSKILDVSENGPSNTNDELDCIRRLMTTRCSFLPLGWFRNHIQNWFVICTGKKNTSSWFPHKAIISEVGSSPCKKKHESTVQVPKVTHPLGLIVCVFPPQISYLLRKTLYFSRFPVGNFPKKPPTISPSGLSHWRSPCRHSAAGRSPWSHRSCCRRWCRWRPATVKLLFFFGVWSSIP